MGSTLLIDGMNLIPSLESLPILLAESSYLAGLVNKFWLFFQVALGLGFVIFVHELGHFLAAKTFGVRCDKFYVGFDVPISIGPIKFPRTLGKFQWGETEYGIGIIPLGGYVKMLGQDDDPRKQAEENAKIRLDADGKPLPAEVDEIPLDPRSYPAKPVWQRMIIISAGVVMNLIFAVILAAIAYRFGVPYTPTVAGSTMGGGPAWVMGVEPGDQVLRFGDMQEDNPQMRYEDFAVGVIMRGFDGSHDALPLSLLRDGQRRDIVVTPTAEYSPDKDIFRIGLNPPTTPKVGPLPYSPNSFLGSQQPDLQPGDIVTAVNGETLPLDPRVNAVLGSELTARLQATWERPVKLSLQRPAAKKGEAASQVEIELPPVPVRTLGLGFAPGPIVAIQTGSPADEAGVRVGDTITAVNGEPVIDGLQLPSIVARLAGKEIRLTLRRPAQGRDAKEDDSRGTDGATELSAAGETIEIVLQAPALASFDPIAELAGNLTLGGVGIAFDVSSKITSIDSRYVGSEIEIGDELTQVHWIADAEEKKELAQSFTSRAFTPRPIDRAFNIPVLYDFSQSIPVGARIKCYVNRAGKTVSSEAQVHDADGWYWHQRGIALSQLTDLYQTDNVATAMNLGLWETSRRFTDVLDFLRLLVTGRIGAKGVGGPVAIVEAASSEASHGVSRLLLFLTLLSANLAILNFLPIPALDGGHMVFLTAEAIRGKPVSEALQIRLTMAGVLGLLSLMAFVIVKDIMRLIS